MSVVTSKQFSALSVAVSLVRKALLKSVNAFMYVVGAMAEARLQRAAIETELYRNRYRHSSKNDDDLPIVR